MPDSEADARGAWAETLVCADLEARGLVLIDRNFRRKCGELDLIMRDAGRVVFVEVRYRASERWGGGLESVTPAKRRRLVRAAKAFLLARPDLKRLPCRFDVVAVTGSSENPGIRWVRGAFDQG
ncbi:MAG: YraN family protein [Pseudomonadales bacterium]